MRDENTPEQRLNVHGESGEIGRSGVDKHFVLLMILEVGWIEIFKRQIFI